MSKKTNLSMVVPEVMQDVKHNSVSQPKSSVFPNLKLISSKIGY
jgi:hypothetical protein